MYWCDTFLLQQTAHRCMFPRQWYITFHSNLRGNMLPRESYHFRHIKATHAICDIFYRPWQYLRETIVVTLRHPFERMVSEYNFIRYRTEFTRIFKTNFTSLSEYIDAPESHNAILKFLMVPDSLYKSDTGVNERSLMVFRASSYILNIVYTFTDEMELSFLNIKDKLGIHIDKSTHARTAIYKETCPTYHIWHGPNLRP